MLFPRMFRVRQRFERPRVGDLAAEVEGQLAGLALAGVVRPGQRVAVAAGSRGISELPVILAAVVRHLGALGVEPFLVPAMGSHGGATEAGQRQVLAGYGVTEASLGCPIEASTGSVVVGHTSSGIPVHFAEAGLAADHVIAVNRVKPHTGFVGEVESGICKMLLIGLGKPEGARVYHRAILDRSFGQILEEALPLLLSRAPVRAGLAVVENAFHEIARVEAIPARRLPDAEKPLLRLARDLLPGLPFPEVDVLIVDEMGKDVSGTGIDTNVVGRRFDDHKAQGDERPRVKRIFVRELTAASHGNALGIGIVDFCTERLLAAVDLEATRTNAITSLHLSAARLPFVYPTEREALEAALQTIGAERPDGARVLWIANTRDLHQIECSEAFLSLARERSDLSPLCAPRPLCFDPGGDLLPFQDPG
jgi:hypothetical protein